MCIFILQRKHRHTVKVHTGSGSGSGSGRPRGKAAAEQGPPATRWRGSERQRRGGQAGEGWRRPARGGVDDTVFFCCCEVWKESWP